MNDNDSGPSLDQQEYVEYYGGAGVQHIAMNTSDIITAVSITSNLPADWHKVLPCPYSADCIIYKTIFTKCINHRLKKVNPIVYADS